MSLKERIKQRDVSKEIVTVQGEKFLIVGKSKRSRAETFAKCKSKKTEKLNFELLEDTLLAECVYDPESNEPLLDVSEWGNVDSAITGPLMSHIMRIVGMDKDDVNPKDSGATET